ncbi:hypothetical protein [Xanthomonas nasturtii]|uniref:hypothetical protein n=1 Tax=Xanthomonas nasturtii TaxID=1843581 RepID=UPI00201381A8|nr:hypothetical protein [Xanthomonas nasturtii]MCL1500310.1 hypothetical protein [Xanthomonas nasturtii]MCL1524511.1 hypothetical protein [Xanthomonas nasturtii]
MQRIKRKQEIFAACLKTDNDCSEKFHCSRKTASHGCRIAGCPDPLHRAAVA